MKSSKTAGRNILGPWNDNLTGSPSQEESEDGTHPGDAETLDPAEVGKLLQTQKAALESFILRLGAAGRAAVDLRKYAEELTNICEYVSVDDRKVVELANNTIRKYA